MTVLEGNMWKDSRMFETEIMRGLESLAMDLKSRGRVEDKVTGVEVRGQENKVTRVEVRAKV